MSPTSASRSPPIYPARTSSRVCSRDQLLTDGLSVLKPLVEKEFPSALPTEVDSFLFNVLGPLVIKLQSPYTP